MGYLEITIGPMFAGKTTALIDKVNRYITVKKQQGKDPKVLIINYIGDDRSETTLSPHLVYKGVFGDNTTHCKVKELKDIEDVEIISTFDYIAIDECQFFKDIGMVGNWLNNKNVHIHCSGLLTDSNKQSFGNLHKIMYLADHIEHIKAFCFFCGDKYPNASFTKCLKQKNNQTEIGGVDSYIPVCGKHFD